MPLSYKNDDRTDERLNPASASSELNNREQAALDQITTGLSDGQTADSSTEDESIKKAQVELGDRESSVDSSNSINYQPSQKLSKSPKKGVIRLMSNRKSLVLFGTTGLAGLALAVMSLLLPLKLDSLIHTVNNKISAVPEYAINQRVEYLTTRWLAMQMMKEAYDGDKNLVFCTGGGILCHLGSTKYASWFQKKLDLKLDKRGMKVTAILNANGRMGLGGKATSFTLELSNRGEDLSSLTRRVSKELSHKDARRHINKLVKEVHGRNYLLRFVSKGILLRQYGIKRFNVVPEKTAVKINDLRAKMKASIIQNTAARLSDRLGAHMACIQGGSALGCQETINSLSDGIDSDLRKAQEAIDNSPEGSDARKKAEADKLKVERRQKSLSEYRSKLSGNIDDTMAKSLSKELIKKIAGPVAIAGMMDMAFNIVEAVDSNILEIISYDRMSQIYTSFAFNQDASPILINDQMRAGIGDAQQIELATSLFDDVEKSLYYQNVFGLLKDDGPYQVMCDTPEGAKLVTLEAAGELICPEAKLVRKYTNLKGNQYWDALASAAKAWNASIGSIFDFVGDLFGAVIGPVWNIVKEAPGIKQIAGFTAEKFGQLMEWALGLIFGIPDIGFDAPGVNNFHALSGALNVSANSSMQYGQDPDNPSSSPVMGAGGKALNDTELAAISLDMYNKRKDEYNSQTFFAKIFDLSFEKSFASQVIASLPTSKSSALGFISNTPSIILSSLTKISKASSYNSDLATLKAFGMPWYGYSDSSVLQADPAIYTEDFCDASAKAREESFGLNGHLIPTYSKEDPCALEKVIGGLLATQINDTSDKNYIREPGRGDSVSVGGPSPQAGSDWSVDKNHNGLIDKRSSEFTAWLTSIGGNGSPSPAAAKPITLPFQQVICPQSNSLNVDGGGNYFHPTAAASAAAMITAYNQNPPVGGGKYLVPSACYRSLSVQRRISGSKNAARAGTSNHGLGLAIDFRFSSSPTGMEGTLPQIHPSNPRSGFNTPTYMWLQENSYKYGWINPKGMQVCVNMNTDCEPWHFQYVGPL